MIRLLLMAAVMAVVTVPASAEDCADYGMRSRTYRSCDVFGHCRYRSRCVRRHQDDAPRVYGYERRDDEPERRDCPHPLLRVVGNQHLTVDGAKKAADEAWAGDVRFRHGEIYMDLNNALHVTYTCSRSSIKEGGVTTLGQSLNRCEIRAKPCQAPRSAPLPPPQDRDDR